MQIQAIWNHASPLDRAQVNPKRDVNDLYPYPGESPLQIFLHVEISLFMINIHPVMRVLKR